MARTIETEPLKKHTLFLYEGDMERLASFFPELPASVVLRRVVRKHIEKLESGVSTVPQMENPLDV